MTSFLSFLLIHAACAYGTYATNTTNANVNTVCYDYVGCFSNLPPFDNANSSLPLSPNQIDTKFLLFTRRNPQTPGYLNYIFPTSVPNSDYQKTAETKIIIHGFSNSINTTWIYAMKDALLKKGNFNVIIVAWGKGAAPPDYDQVVSNTRVVGTQLRLVIEKLVQAGGRLTDIHIIGHSLGAHTAGLTGRLLQGKVARITGLDPAEPDFENHPPGVRLDPSDAAFVDVIHTNGLPFVLGGAGLMQVSGHVDFYVNGGKRQPGCPEPLVGAISSILNHNETGALLSATCSHSRAHMYFTESILSNCTFTAYPCNSYEMFRNGECRSCGLQGCSQLGLYADRYTGRGKLYLNTQISLTGPFCGYQYLVTTVFGANETVGQLFLTIHGLAEATHRRQQPITDYDEHFEAGGHITRVVVLADRLPDITSVDVLYKKKRSFLFGWADGRNQITLTSVSIAEMESNKKITFCLRGIMLADGITTTATQRPTTSKC